MLKGWDEEVMIVLPQSRWEGLSKAKTWGLVDVVSKRMSLFN